MRRNNMCITGILVLLTIFVFCDGMGNRVFGQALYDDFAGASINATKWQNAEAVRRVSGGRLRLKVRSIPSYSSPPEIHLSFVNPQSIASIQAHVTPTTYDNTQGASASARIGGRFFNDGTAGGGLIGDIFAGIMIGGSGPTPVAYWAASRHTNASNPDMSTGIATQQFSKAITLGTTYTLSLSWDGTTFTFTISGGAGGDETLTYTPVMTRNPANSPWRGLQARISNNAGKEATVGAGFDNVVARDGAGNVVMSEDFTSDTIDNTKWSNYEFEREIESGQMRSMARSSAGYTTVVNNAMTMSNATAAAALQATTTPIAANNPQNIYVRASVEGVFFNDGTAGGGRVGDVGGQTRIRATSTGYVAEWNVFKFVDTADNTVGIQTGSFAAVPVAGNPYVMYVGWDGAKFTFKFGAETQFYTPLSPIYLPKQPFRDVSTKVIPEATNKEAMIAVYFDNVMTESATDDAQIRGNFAALINGYNNKNITTVMSFFSLNFLDNGDNYDTRRTSFQNEFSSPNFQPLTYTIDSLVVDGNTATLAVSFGDGNQDGMTFRKEADNVWRVYGNQQKYQAKVPSARWVNGYYVNPWVDDPSHTATAVTVTGTGITGTLNLTYHAEWGGWGPAGMVFLGASKPVSYPAYVVTVTDGTGSYPYNLSVNGWVDEFAGNMAPQGQAGGPITFSWTGIPNASEYKVEVSNNSGAMIWQVSDIPGNVTSTFYSGPALSAGQTYSFLVIAERRTLGVNNSSFSQASFTYNVSTTSYGATVQTRQGAALANVNVELTGDPAVHVSTDVRGQFSFVSGLPYRNQFSLKMTLDGYVPMYTRNFFFTGTNTSPVPYVLYRAADLLAWGVQTGKGAITGRALDNSNTEISITGAVVTARSALHPDVAYVVTYVDDGGGLGGTSTYGNGKFIVLNVDDGDTVMLMAAKDGWGFMARTADTHGDSVSNVILFGDPVPILPNYTATAITHPVPQTGAGFGLPVTTIADLNSDGVAEIAVSASFQDSGTGKVFILNGVNGTLLQTINPPAGTGSDAVNGNFGIAGAGSFSADLDGGGKMDFFITGPRDAVSALAQAGRLHIYRGEDYSLIRTIASPFPQVNELFGERAGSGDVSGDSTPELIIAAPGYNGSRGRVYIFNPQTGTHLYTIDDPNPEAGTRFGFRRALVDVDGDGKFEIVISNHSRTVGGLSAVGVVYVFNGEGTLMLTIPHPEPQANAMFGYMALSINDQDQDGMADIVVSAPGQNNYRGAAYIFSGATGQLIRKVMAPTGEQQDGAQFGRMLGGARDINKDGIGDLAIAAPFQNVSGTGGAGRIYFMNGKNGVLFSGSLVPPALQVNQRMGVGNVTSQGDANGDTIVDLVTSAGYQDQGGYTDVGVVYLFMSQNQYRITGRVKEIPSDTDLGQVTVNAVNNGTGSTAATAQTDGSGNYTLILPGSAFYRVEASKAGYVTETVPQIIEISDTQRTAAADTIYLSVVNIGQMALVQGWNFISFPLLPANKTIGQVLPEDVQAQVRIIWGWDNTTQTFTKWTPAVGGDNTLTEFAFGKGYWIYVNAQGTINLTGWQAAPSGTIHLGEGWNLVGYLGTDGKDVTNSLSTIAGKWAVIWNWTSAQWSARHAYLPLPQAIPSLGNLFQGKAYWVRIRPGQATDWTQ